MPCIEDAHANVLFENKGSGRIGESVGLKIMTDPYREVAHRRFYLERSEIIVGESNVALFSPENKAKTSVPARLNHGFAPPCCVM